MYNRYRRAVVNLQTLFRGKRARRILVALKIEAKSLKKVGYL
jgi:hypothetical protein